MVGTSGQATAPFNDRNVSLEALAESEQRSRTLVEALPDAILVHSEDRIVFVNPFCVRLLGAAGPEQLLGKDINEIVNPDDLPAIRNRIQDCYASGTASPPMESVLIACDGSSVEVEAVAIPICWNGAPAIEVVARDIRDRKRAERAVQDWKERLVLAQKAGLRIGLWDWDVVANTVIWSDETYRQFGYTRDTFSGRVEDAVTRIHLEDRPKVEDAIRKVIAGGGEYAQQYRLVWPNGTTCWVDAHGVMVRNGCTHMLGIGVDITDLKKTEQSLQESEEKYLLLLNSTAEAIYGLDLEGDCTFCNPACLRLLGYRAPKDLLGTNMHELIHHTRADGTRYPKQDCEIYVAVREGRASHVTDEVLWRADRTSFTAEYWSYPMYKTGELVGAVVTFLDVTEQRRAEEQLRHSQEDLARVTRVAAMAELAAAIAHEVNQPLGAVVANGSASLRWLARESPNLEEAREAIEMTVREANRASDVIRRIRAMLQKVPPHMERLDVNAVIREALTLAGDEFLRGGVAVQADLAPDVPNVLGDRIQLQQVLLNLILNGIDAMRKISHQSRELIIKSAKHSEGVLIQVHDSGVGVDPEQADRIFEPFFTTKPQGIGMGLSISRSIIEAHGGRLWFTPGPSHGVVFQFTLPKADTSDERAA
jgi:PAS domain S-box-containing protein